MIAVVAHNDPATRRAAAQALLDARWEVHEAAAFAEALEACRRTGADVLLAGEDQDGGQADMVEALKRDPHLFHVAVVLVCDDPDVAHVLDAVSRGAADIVRTPLHPADVVARAFAAARTKALIEELTAQDARLEELVFFDELTGLRNRRAVLHEVEVLVAGAERHGHDLSVLMLDLDRFKTINDRYGHRAGDEVLREVSRRLRGRLRRADVAGRLGGDELLVALPDTGAAGAVVLADSIRAAITQGPVRTSAGPIDVTVSIGAAQWRGGDVGQLLEEADRALYAAKDAGRDRSVAA